MNRDVAEVEDDEEEEEKEDRALGWRGAAGW
jgi:hypothetical protein